METPYALAMKELKQRRESNKAEQHRRIGEVRSKNPDYTRIEQGMAEQGSSLARRVLEGSSSIADIAAAIQGYRKERCDLLTALGLSPDYLEDLYTCPHCRDTGFLESGSRCACLKQLIERYTLANANLTEYMKEQTFDRFNFSLFSKQPALENGHQPAAVITRAYEKGLKFAETFDSTHSNLLLLGPAGTGKTFLSGCIANYALARGKSVYYQTAFTLFDLLEKLKFGRIPEEEQEKAEAIARYIYEADLLIIDDLGTEFVSGYSTAALFDLINNRLIHGKSVILSSNLSLKGLEQLYSQRVTSRLMGSYEVIPFVGKDLRMKNLD